MYKAIASFWSKASSNKTPSTSETKTDEDSWVFVPSIGKSREGDSLSESPGMTNSWIASPPLVSSENLHHFNPIENLLIEHASMSVYEQIESKARHRRQKKILNDNKLDEQTEEEEGGEEEDRTSLTHQQSIHYRSPNQSSTTTLDSSTSSLVAHHRHLHRLHQRRKRSKLLLDESKPVLNKTFDRTRLRPRTNPS